MARQRKGSSPPLPVASAIPSAPTLTQTAALTLTFAIFSDRFVIFLHLTEGPSRLPLPEPVLGGVVVRKTLE